jgi:Uncharacterized protein conserved in bacteria (DUF2184)
MLRSHDFALLERTCGIVLPDVVGWLDSSIAMDAQPASITVSNQGIPAFLQNYMDPKVIEVLTTPNKAAEILGETKKGDWVTRTATFIMVEAVGETSSYGDWNNNGAVNANAQFPERQSYHYQTITQWGEKQLAEAGLAGLDWASRLNIASAMVLDKFQNQTYFFGVAGLRNFGLLNDPDLPAPISPRTKAAGGTSWTQATPNEIFSDIQDLYAKLVIQSGGNINRESKLVLATTPERAIYLANKNSFGLSVYEMMKGSKDSAGTFPNVRFVEAVQYAVAGGNLVQLLAEEVDGQDVGTCAFTEKLRAHPIIPERSAFSQKKSQGTWGAIIFMPMAIAGMLGI